MHQVCTNAIWSASRDRRSGIVGYISQRSSSAQSLLARGLGEAMKVLLPRGGEIGTHLGTTAGAPRQRRDEHMRRQAIAGCCTEACQRTVGKWWKQIEGAGITSGLTCRPHHVRRQGGELSDSQSEPCVQDRRQHREQSRLSLRAAPSFEHMRQGAHFGVVSHAHEHNSIALLTGRPRADARRQDDGWRRSGLR